MEALVIVIVIVIVIETSNATVELRGAVLPSRYENGSCMHYYGNTTTVVLIFTFELPYRTVPYRIKCRTRNSLCMKV